MPASERPWLWIVALVSLPPLLVMALLPPLAQNLAYHDFADQRSWLGIPNFANVVSNLPFLLVGLLGLRHVIADWHSKRQQPGERYAQLVLFAAIALTGPGSAWYHLDPSNETLVWDRGPIALGFMALFSILICERVSVRAGSATLIPLCAIGLFSVIWWALKDDLRLYAIVQFYPLLMIVPILLWLPSRYSRGSWWWVVLAWYAIAKLCEAADAWLFEVIWVSGHMLKHLFAALGAWWVLRILQRRRLL